MVYKVLHNLALAYQPYLVPPKFNHTGLFSSFLNVFCCGEILLCILQSISFSLEAHRKVPFSISPWILVGPYMANEIGVKVMHQTCPTCSPWAARGPGWL